MTVRIVQLLNCLRAHLKIFFQWLSPHMNACGNEIADGLAHKDSHKDSWWLPCFFRIATRVKQDINSSWRQAPVHELYEGNRPDVTSIETSSE
ncbi:uncharacterized protein TNCV_1955781 [Trichonephila clavipes]|nr:uncharacterized protein TNCV_1955781 [Trichonephila clavipes]